MNCVANEYMLYYRRREKPSYKMKSYEQSYALSPAFQEINPNLRYFVVKLKLVLLRGRKNSYILKINTKIFDKSFPCHIRHGSITF